MERFRKSHGSLLTWPFWALGVYRNHHKNLYIKHQTICSTLTINPIFLPLFCKPYSTFCSKLIWWVMFCAFFCASLWEMIAVRQGYHGLYKKDEKHRENLWAKPVFAIFSVRAKLLQMSMLCRLAWIMGFRRIICREAFERTKPDGRLFGNFTEAQEKSTNQKPPLSSFRIFFIPSVLATNKINLNYQ